jgi:hypothetical protein
MLRLISPLTFFLILAGASPVFAENEVPDFSVFADPNAPMPTQSKSHTAAEPPCITCRQERPKTENLKAVRNVGEKLESSSKSSCITCGRVSLNDNKSNKKSLVEKGIWDQYPQISGYSDSNQVKNMISYAQRHSRRSSYGKCYRYVKQALCGDERPRCKAGSMVSGYPSGNPVFADLPSSVKKSQRIGVNAIKTLKAHQFINLLDNPEFNEIIKNPASAPKGAIMIYQGGKNGGHIEIKTGYGATGSYISDFSAPDSVMKNELGGRASAHYKLVGVMIKPAEKL